MSNNDSSFLEMQGSIGGQFDESRGKEESTLSITRKPKRKTPQKHSIGKKLHKRVKSTSILQSKQTGSFDSSNHLSPSSPQNTSRIKHNANLSRNIPSTTTKLSISVPIISKEPQRRISSVGSLATNPFQTEFKTLIKTQSEKDILKSIQQNIETESNIHNENERLKNQLNEKVSQISALKLELDEMRREKLELENKSKQMHQDLSEAEERIELLERQNEDLEVMMQDETMNYITSTSPILTSDPFSLLSNPSVAQRKEKKRRKSIKKGELHEKVKDLTMENEALMNKLDQVEHDRDTLKKDLELERMQLLMKIEEIEESHVSQVKDEEEKRQRKKLEDENKKLRLDLNAMKEKYECSIITYEDQITQFKRKENVKVLEKENIKTTISNLEKKIQKMKEKDAKRNQELVQLKDEKLVYENIIKEKHHIQATFDADRAESISKINEMEKERASLLEKLVNLSKQIEESSRIIDDQRIEISNYKANVAQQGQQKLNELYQSFLTRIHLLDRYELSNSTSQEDFIYESFMKLYDEVTALKLKSMEENTEHFDYLFSCMARFIKKIVNGQIPSQLRLTVDKQLLNESMIDLVDSFNQLLKYIRIPVTQKAEEITYHHNPLYARMIRFKDGKLEPSSELLASLYNDFIQITENINIYIKHILDDDPSISYREACHSFITELHILVLHCQEQLLKNPSIPFSILFRLMEERISFIKFNALYIEQKSQQAVRLSQRQSIGIQTTPTPTILQRIFLRRRPQ